MEIWKLITIIIGASGFWKIIDLLIKYRSDKKLKMAEAKNLHASAQSSIVQNWIEWSQTLEKRVKESEEHTLAMEAIFKQQRERIRCLEQKVEKMEQENRELLQELAELKKVK